MAKPPAQRQREWLDRLYLKARLFEEAECKRRADLRRQFANTLGDEELIESVRKFFLAYPGCRTAPHIVELRKGVLEAVFLREVPATETAAAFVALSEVSDTDPVQICVARDGVTTGVSPHEHTLTTVLRQRAELIAANLWEAYP